MDVVVHGSAALAASNIKIKVGPQSRDKGKNFTIHVEWDGGGEETLSNPEWRMKGDAPDKQGRVSHRDAKVSSDVPLGGSKHLWIMLMKQRSYHCTLLSVHSCVHTLNTG